MESVINALLKAIPWVFSGVGVFVVGLIIKKSVDRQQKLEVSKKSIGIQAGRDVNIIQGQTNERTKTRSKRK